MLARVLLIAVMSFSVIGCEKTNHENIDKWMNTAKGPEKLKSAIRDEGLDPDLSAHAAANMILKNEDAEVRAALEQMSQPRRAQLIGKLAPRLWTIARIEREDALPAPQQTNAKDALINLRKYADDAQRTQIDTYLIDWYGVKSYEARAKNGSTLGAPVMRLVGPAGGKKLIAVLNALIAEPGQDQKKNFIGDELMLGMAASGNPDAVRYLLEVARMDRGEPTLAKRAMEALRIAYVDPGGLFDMADPAALAPNIDALVAVARDEKMAGRPGNNAIELIRAIGSPKCEQPLIDMIGLPHPEKNFRYSAAYAALLCGGVKVIPQVVRALPDSTPYAQGDLHGAVIGEIAKMTPRDQVLASLRELLNDKGKVAKWVAIEALATMKSVEDAPKIAALAKNPDKLVGFFGDQSGKDPSERKTDPTLGQRAKELAAHLTGAPTPTK